ncbi:hypothetical protein BK146_07585 [Paenibacillus sp. FSL R7-0333]|nr:hypothetical protein BK146_07585 [Paenibacillus sp. FSL R7-0333]
MNHLNEGRVDGEILQEVQQWNPYKRLVSGPVRVILFLVQAIKRIIHNIDFIENSLFPGANFGI